MLKRLTILLAVACLSTAVQAKTLTLNDSIQKALKTLHRENAELLSEIASFDRDLQEQIYTGTWSAATTYINDLTVKTNAFAPDIVGYSADISYQKRLKSGTSLSTKAEFNRYELESPVFSAPYFEPRLTIGLEQDLWRNRFGRLERLGLTQADNIKILQQLTAHDALEETIYQATVGFWEVALTEAQLKTAQNARDNAKKIYDLNKRKERSGLSEPRTVYAFEADLHQRELALSQAKLNFENAREALQVVLQLEETPVLEDNAAKLMGLVANQRFELNWDEQRDTLRRIQMAELQLANEALADQASTWESAPQVRVFSQLGINGLDANSDTAFDRFNELTNSVFQVGVRLSLPKRNMARLQRDRNTMATAVQTNNLTLLEDDLKRQISVMARTLKHLKAAMTISQKQQLALEKKYNDDQQQFNAGRIDADELIQSQNLLTGAVLAHTETNYRYLQAIGQFFRLENTLMDRIIVLAEAMSNDAIDEEF